MMKKIASFSIGILLLSFPAFAAAEGVPLQPTEEQLLVRVAALGAQLEALTSGTSPACAVLASRMSVRVNETFILAWGSVGAMDIADDPALSQWPRNGVSKISVQKPGLWLYKFRFYGFGGASTTCSTTVSVS